MTGSLHGLDMSGQLMESLPDAVFVVAADGRIVGVNAQAEHLFGYARHELVGQLIETLVPPEVRDIHPAHRRGYVQDARVRPMGAGLDLTGLRRDGSRFPAEISLSSIETDEGRFVTAVVRDVTERIKTQAKFEGLLEAAPDAMLGVDADGVIRLVNGQAERLFGYPRSELLGRPIETLVPDRVRAIHPSHRRGYFRAPEMRPMGAGLELSGRRKDGSEFPAEISLSSIDSEDGVLVTAAVRDVSERKAFEAVVAAARDTAERAARARQEFLANMSHEIRTPMNAVIGMTSLLLDTELDADQRDFVETIRASGDHLLTVINDILDYSKIDAGKLVLEELTFDVRSWIAESLDLVAAQASEKRLELVCDVDPAVPGSLVGDPGRLRQVLVNLLSNAVKFTESGEVVVRMDVAEQGESASLMRCSVSDTGVGIDPGRVAALFDPFTQADSTTTRVFGGTGLGLAISKHLSERMGGSIELTSQAGEGTSVTFTFLGGHCEQGPSAQPVALTDRRILVVDDNATNRRILGTWLRAAGAEVVEADSGEQALELASSGTSPQAAVLDLMMPEMDGVELAGRLARACPETRLVLLSSAGPYGREAVGREVFAATLTKPAKREQMLEVLGRVLAGGGLAGTSAHQEPSPFTLRNTARMLSVLVVEDNPINQKVARHLLSRFGVLSDVAASGLEAVQALEQRHYDLVLMDVQMPEMDGIEATLVIRERWPDRDVRIVALTANVAGEDVAQCLEAGMDAFLGKPIVLEELAMELEAVGGGAGTLARTQHETDGAADPGVLVDAAALSKLRGQLGDDSVRSLAEMYVGDLGDAIGELQGAMVDRAAPDHARLASVAHRVKSSSRSLAANGIGDLLEQLETSAKQGDTASSVRLVDQLVALHPHIEPAFHDALG